MAREKPPAQPDFDDPSFQTQKLPGTQSRAEQLLEGQAKGGTVDRRLKAMEEAVQRAKTKNQVPGVSTQDDYSEDAEPQSDNLADPSTQKAVSTLKIKRVKGGQEPEPAPQAMSTLKVNFSKEADEEPAGPLLGWQHWLLLFISLLVAGGVFYVVVLK